MSAVILPFPRRAQPSEEERRVTALVRRIEAALALPVTERGPMGALSEMIEQRIAGS
jgi:hypothetical protein